MLDFTRSTRGVPSRVLIYCLLAAMFGSKAQSATVASQDFGASQVGTPAAVNVAIPSVTPGPPVLSLRYSTDYSLGSCSGNGCSVPITFNPIKPGLRQDAVIVKDANGQIVEEILLHGIGLGPLPVFSPALTTLKAYVPIGESYSINSIAATPDGKVLLASGFQNAIFRFDPVANTLTAVPGLPAPSGSSRSLELAPLRSMQRATSSTGTATRSCTGSMRLLGQILFLPRM